MCDTAGLRGLLWMTAEEFDFVFPSLRVLSSHWLLLFRSHQRIPGLEHVRYMEAGTDIGESLISRL